MKNSYFTKLRPGTLIICWFVLVVGVLALLAVERPQTQQIADASKPHRLAFSPNSIFDPSGYSIRVSGVIDGVGTIVLPESQPQQISGAVDWTIGHDFFHPPLVAEYDPINVRRGQLTFRVTFQ